MKMNYKRFAGLLGIFLAFSLLFVACDNGSGDDGSSDPAIRSIEDAFTKMLNTNLAGYASGSSSSADYKAIKVDAIKRMNDWGQTDSKYRVTNAFGSIGGSFGRLTGSNASIEWGTPNADGKDLQTDYSGYYVYWGSGENGEYEGSFRHDIYRYPDSLRFRIPSGSNAKTVMYPYTIHQSDDPSKTIKGNLELYLSKWKWAE